MMISTAEAFNILLTSGISERVCSLPLNNCLGKMLAQDIICDHDLPPFDRVMMDGFAISYSGLSAYSSFEVRGEQRAGFPPISLESQQHAIVVMTGCVIPVGCDTVVPVEYARRNGALVEFTQENISKGQHIHQRAMDHILGDVLVAEGARIHSGIIAIAASCGLTELKVRSVKSASILSTGDELVDIHMKPLAWQIRKSNSFLLSSALQGLGILNSTHHCMDDKRDITEKIEGCVSDNLILMSGGVSMGKFDLVPDALMTLGFKILFHKVLQKPGKPLLAAIRNDQLVIAFPGNPVSVMACVCRYLLPLLDVRFRNQFVIPGEIKCSQSTLTMLLPVSLRVGESTGRVADALRWNGSGDFASLSGASGFVEMQSGLSVLPDELRYFPIS